MESNNIQNLDEVVNLKSDRLKFLYASGAGTLKKLPII